MTCQTPPHASDAHLHSMPPVPTVFRNQLIPDAPESQTAHNLTLARQKKNDVTSEGNTKRDHAEEKTNLLHAANASLRKGLPLPVSIKVDRRDGILRAANVIDAEHTRQAPNGPGIHHLVNQTPPRVPDENIPPSLSVCRPESVTQHPSRSYDRLQGAYIQHHGMRGTYGAPAETISSSYPVSLTQPLSTSQDRGARFYHRDGTLGREDTTSNEGFNVYGRPSGDNLALSNLANGSLSYPGSVFDQPPVIPSATTTQDALAIAPSDDKSSLGSAVLHHLTALHRSCSPSEYSGKNISDLSARAAQVLLDEDLAEKDPFQAALGLVFLSELGLHFNYNSD
ncbi:hypothetical protein HGRIS_005730 [Hohenbuehelia grisea]|uniref:Uncharacterized protein n=1 Tax=Hohenbuehelia grisea TaxID=104357 RepID=A0ABR3JYR7_9AGAR